MFVPAEIAEELPDYIAAALFNALQVNPESRTRSVDKFRDQLSTAPAVSRLREDEGEDDAETDPDGDAEDIPEEKSNRVKYAVLIVLSVFVFLLILAGLAILLMFPNLIGGPESSTPVNQPPGCRLSPQPQGISMMQTQNCHPDLRKRTI